MTSPATLMVAQRMVLWHGHLDQRSLLAPANLGDVAADGGLADHGAILLHQALPHPPCRVALLARRAAVSL
jgi:hypothetical protein